MRPPADASRRLAADTDGYDFRAKFPECAEPPVFTEPGSGLTGTGAAGALVAAVVGAAGKASCRSGGPGLGPLNFTHTVSLRQVLTDLASRGLLREPTLAEARAHRKSTFRPERAQANAMSMQGVGPVSQPLGLQWASWVRGEEAMRAAIMAYGPLVALLDIYPDLLDYRLGVYAPTDPLAPRLGTLPVQVVGWGTSVRGDPYWIVEGAPTWGLWGENERGEMCTSLDCHGPACLSIVNRNPQCQDDPGFVDYGNRNCAWYRDYDPKCLLFADAGQLDHCPVTCRTCPPSATYPGEVCGYARVLRGKNAASIETTALHVYVGAASDAPLMMLCADDMAWQDSATRGCGWYAEHAGPGCLAFLDQGQRAACPRACGLCF